MTYEDEVAELIKDKLTESGYDVDDIIVTEKSSDRIDQDDEYWETGIREWHGFCIDYECEVFVKKGVAPTDCWLTITVSDNDEMELIDYGWKMACSI